MEIASSGEAATTASVVSEADKQVELSARRFHLSSKMLERVVESLGKKDLKRLVYILVEYPLHSENIQVTEALQKTFELIQDMIIDKNIMMNYTQKQLDAQKVAKQAETNKEGNINE